jgi:hypothetical protein
VTPAEVDICTPTPKARLLDNGMLIPPRSAPARVKAVIAAANRIRTKPYIYGGGHGRWWDRGYDCSGSVSYALHGGNFLTSPLPSGPLASWGTGGRGRWITVYTNPGHAFVVIAGLRFDTGYRDRISKVHGAAPGSGPRWGGPRPTRGYRARHPDGL